MLKLSAATWPFYVTQSLPVDQPVLFSYFCHGALSHSVFLARPRARQWTAVHLWSCHSIHVQSVSSDRGYRISSTKIRLSTLTVLRNRWRPWHPPHSKALCHLPQSTRQYALPTWGMRIVIVTTLGSILNTNKSHRICSNKKHLSTLTVLRNRLVMTLFNSKALCHLSQRTRQFPSTTWGMNIVIVIFPSLTDCRRI